MAIALKQSFKVLKKLRTTNRINNKNLLVKSHFKFL